MLGCRVFRVWGFAGAGAVGFRVFGVAGAVREVWGLQQSTLRALGLGSFGFGICDAKVAV